MQLNIAGSVHGPNDPVGRLLPNVLAMVAEFEADLIRARTREGMAVAKAKGRLQGKKLKLNARREARLLEAFGTGKDTIAELAEEFGVSRSTVYRGVQRARQRAVADRGGGRARAANCAGQVAVGNGKPLSA